jgi:hypothetical protein
MHVAGFAEHIGGRGEVVEAVVALKAADESAPHGGVSKGHGVASTWFATSQARRPSGP